MLNYKSLLINENSTILEAMKVIDSSKHRICFVTKNQIKLIGSITDGDIRRGLLKKVSFKDRAIKICNKKPIYLKFKKKLSSLSNHNETCIPVIDQNKKILNVKIIQKKINRIKSVIMAGGKGERLYPITKNIPKPLVKVKGKTLLESLIYKLNNDGISNIRISIHHMKKKIKTYLKSKKFSFYDTNFIIEKRPLGTAGSIKKFNLIDKDFFVVNCDIKLNVDFSKISNFHLDQNADITIVSKQMINKLSFGKLNINSKFDVLSIDEKPIITNYISTGVYIVNKKIKKLIKPNQNINMDEIIKIAISKKMKVISYPLYENWSDLGIRKNLKRYQKSKNFN